MNEPLLGNADETETARGNRLVLPTEFIDFDAIAKRYYLTPYLLHTESAERILTDHDHNLGSSDRRKLESHRRIASEVNTIVDNIVHHLSEEASPLFRGGELSLCGSVKEGAKVGSCDEFDYQYLVTLSNVKATRQPPLRTRPASSAEATKSFFRLALEERVEGETHRELPAKEVHDCFKDEVARSLSMQILPYQYLLKKAGPAVKIVLWDWDEQRRPKCFVKIDLTFGLKAVPSDLYDDSELTPLARSLPWDLTFKCHFVCAHDYWKVAFVETEQELMRKISQQDPYKMATYRAIKCLRDMADIKDPYGDGILPSYPIKMTFLDIALTDTQNGVEWKMEDVADHVIRVLREVEERGENNRLTSPFLSGDYVMTESDRSYLESRRILKKLRYAEDVFLRQQNIFLFIQSAFSIVACLVFTLSCVGCEFGDLYDQVVKSKFLQVIPLATLPAQLLTSLIDIIGSSNNRKVYPFYEIYHDTTRVETALLSLTGLGFAVGLAGVTVDGLTQDKLAQVAIFTFCLLLAYAPALVYATSVSLNASYSLHFNKNLQLFNSLLLFPPLAWEWRSPGGRCLKYLPEIPGENGLKGFARKRAILVLILTPLAIALTILIPISINFTAVYIESTGAVSTLALSQIEGVFRCVCLLLILLIMTVILLLFQQFYYTPSWRVLLKRSWEFAGFDERYLNERCCCCPRHAP